MTTKRGLLLLVASLAVTMLFTASKGRTQGQTVGLFLNEPGASAGYSLFSPLAYTDAYLINNSGRLVHSWHSPYKPSANAYLLENGNLMRSAAITPDPVFAAGLGTGGRLEEYSWDGDLVWSFEYSNAQHVSHHDIEVLPNGNVLLIAWEYKTADDAIAAGRDPNLLEDGDLWPDSIIEVHPTGPTTGDIVWEWHTWDHLIQDRDPAAGNYGDVAQHPELADINYFDSTQPAGGDQDWMHSNSISYNAELDQIMLSVRHFSEFWVIDHSTTTAQAASHSGGHNGKGGDILYRWGNPQAYRAGGPENQQFFLQHDAEWIAPGLPGAGDITVFNNGNGRPGGNFSAAEEIVPPVDGEGNYSLTPGQAYGPASPIWTYAASVPSLFYSPIISSVQRLPNGDTLICNGVFGVFFEVTPSGEIVWSYVNPVNGGGPVRQYDSVPAFTNFVHRVLRYPPEYAGLQGKDLTPGGPIELEPLTPKPSPTNTPTATETSTPTPTSTPTATPTYTPSPTPTSTPTRTPTRTPALPCGDVNGDGNVNSVDAQFILQYEGGLIQTLLHLAQADANGDGSINSIDASLILQKEAGLTVQLHC